MTETAPNRPGVLAFAAMIAAGAVALWLGVLPLLPVVVTKTSIAGGLLVTAGFVVASVATFNYRRGDESEAVTLSNLVLAIGLATVQPHVVIVGRVVAEYVANAVDRREPVKSVVNVSVALTEVVGASICFAAVIELIGVQYTWIAVVAAGLLAQSLSFVLVSTAIGIYTRTPTGWFDSPASFGVGTASLDSALGAMFVVVYRAEPTAAILLAAVPAALYLGYKSHAELAAEHRKLEMLTTLTTALAGVKDDRKLAGSLLDHVVDLTGASGGWLIVDSGGALSVVRSRGLTDTPRRRASMATGFERALHAVHAESPAPRAADAALYLPDDSMLGSHLRDAGLHQVLAASVSTGGLVATIAVADPVRAVRWERVDRESFATLAAQAGAALRVGNLSDRLEREMAALSTAETVDPLTELANRASFTAQLEAALDATDRVAVLELDLDRFATVNTALGHRNGDLLLRAVAGRIRGAVRSTDLVARIGGDEFAVLMRDASAEDASMVAENVLARLSAGPFVLAGISVTVGASVGIARSPGDGEDSDGLLRCAHVALREAKLSPGSIRHFDAAPERFSARRLSLATDLNRAVDRSDFTLAWQPQFDLRTGEVVGAEALARWEHPEHGPVSPGEFIPLAEEIGLIAPFTRRIVELAADELAQLAAAGHPLRGSVNLSVHNLLETDLADAVAAVLARTGLSPDLLRFEITETAAMVDPTTTKAQLATLATLGTSVSVDDFGTGYSSLAYLHDLHASEVKIDRVFTAGLSSDPSAESIIRAIVGLAHELDLEVVAEGIEDDATVARLRSLGCDIGQGYRLARPMPMTELTALLDAAPRASA